MNDIIVRLLLKEFPPPTELADRVEHALYLVHAMREAKFPEISIDLLADGLDQTLRDLAEGRIPAEPDVKQKIADALSRWDEQAAEAERDRLDSLEVVEPVDGDADPFGDDSR